MNIDVVIIGAGPAGVAAAIQLTRAGKKIVLFEANRIGGLLNSAHFVENFPGHPEGIPGHELTDLFIKHLENLKIRPIYEPVLSAAWNGQNFCIDTPTQNIAAKHVIAASGTRPKPVSLSFPQTLMPCIHSEITGLLDTKNSQIAIIGGGDAAFDYALNLANNNKVSLIIRKRPVCIPLLYQRAKGHPNIEIMNEMEIEKITDASGKLRIADHLLFAIGREPNMGYLKIDKTLIEQLQRLKKLFIVGDLKNGLHRQSTIAIGDGINAAMDIQLCHCDPE